MSHIAVAIDTEIRQAKKTAAQLSRASGVNEAQISRLKSGEQIWVSAEDLVKLAGGLCPPKSEAGSKCHARLLYARLLDECSGPGAKFLQINLLDNPSPTTTTGCGVAKSVLPPSLQKNLDTIAEHIAANRHVRDFVQTIADFCRHQPLSPAHSN